MDLNQEQKDAYQKAAFVCSKGEKSSNKIWKKLQDWGLSENEADVVLELLLAEKYIDDERYARIYVRDKFRFNKWGRIKIAYQLRADRISSRIVDEALDEIDDSAYKETLMDLLRAKSPKIKAENEYDKKAKLARFAQGRGFENDLIFKSIDVILKS